MKKRRLTVVALIVAVAASVTAATAFAITGGDLPDNETSGNVVVTGVTGGDPGTTAIEVKSWSWGVTSEVASGGGGGSGRATLQELSVVKTVDKASPVLALKCATGQHIPRVVLTVDRPGGSNRPFLEITLDNVLITAVQPGGTDNNLPLEHVSFAYEEIKLKYTTVDDEVVQAILDNRE
jgi:type VI secretion system secreted protein Hcp